MVEDCLVDIEELSGEREGGRGGCSGVCKKGVRLDPDIKLN